MLRLRPFKNCDAEIIVKWIKDEVSFRKWCADRYDNYPIVADDMIKMYNDLSYVDGFYQMTAFDENGIVGHLMMRFTDKQKNIIRFGFVIVDDKKRGLGYGKEMLLLSIKYAFEVIKVQKITIVVFENNMPAYYCYKSVGFKEVETNNVEYYHIFDEDWKSIELEMYNPN